MTETLGTLLVTLKCGRDLKVKGGFRQDPFCIICCGEQHKTSKVHMNGSRNPTWNETFTFLIDQETEISLQIKDNLKAQTIIGNATIKLDKALEKGTDYVQAPVCIGKNLYEGVVVLQLKFQQNKKEERGPVPRLYVTPPPEHGAPGVQKSWSQSKRVMSTSSEISVSASVRSDPGGAHLSPRYARPPAHSKPQPVSRHSPGHPSSRTVVVAKQMAPNQPPQVVSKAPQTHHAHQYFSQQQPSSSHHVSSQSPAGYRNPAPHGHPSMQSSSSKAPSGTSKSTKGYSTESLPPQHQGHLNQNMQPTLGFNKPYQIFDAHSYQQQRVASEQPPHGYPAYQRHPSEFQEYSAPRLSPRYAYSTPESYLAGR